MRPQHLLKLYHATPKILLWFVVVGAASPVFANDDLPTESEVQELGLTVHWQAQTERTQRGTGNAGIAIWSHTKIRNQIITIKVGDRIVERIDANDVDSTAMKKLVYQSANPSATKRLGIEAARQQADMIVARYAKLGKKAEKFEVDQAITYLVSVSNDGAVQALNGETGELLWSNAIGDFRLPTYGPGINDQFVTVVNGYDLFILDLVTGRTLGKRRLTESPSATPQPIGQLVYVPGIKGSLIAYQGDKLEAEPISVRFTDPLTAPVVASQDGKFLAWPNKNHLYLAQSGSQFKLWSRVETNSTFRSMPQLTEDGFLAVASSGMVYRISTKKEQTKSIVWRENLAAPVGSPPVVARGIAMIVSDIGDGYALDINTGDLLWRCSVPDLSRVLSITEKRVYAQRKAGQLVAIDRSNGKAVANLGRSFAQGVFNTVNDRVLLRSLSGSLICLREAEAIDPILNLATPNKTNLAATTPAIGPSAVASEPAIAPAANDPFSSGPPANDAPLPASDDPFMTSPPPPGPAAPADPQNPFGT
jgi:outer membrane protein assembly factor BamB